jgi:hypothetical protein
LKAWQQIKDDYRNKTYGLLSDVAAELKINVDEDQMEQDVSDMFDMENWIANQVNTPADTRRNFQR